MNRLFAQFALPALVLMVCVSIVRLADLGWIVLVTGFGVAVLTAGILALHSSRRLDSIRAISESARAGDPIGPPSHADFDAIDHAVYAAWRMADAAEDAQSSLRARVGEQQMLLDRLEEGIMCVSSDGIVRFANVSAATLFGGRNPLGRSFIRVTRDHELHGAMTRCLSGGSTESVMLHMPGDPRQISVSVSALQTEPRSAMVVFRDVTEVTRLLNLRRDFVANVSHELRTPLSTIKILTETLLELRPHDGEAVQFLERIDGEVDAMTALVRDLLELARLEAAAATQTTQPLDLRTIVDDVRDRLASLAARGGVQLLVESPASAVIATVDERRIHQALLNLGRNAIDHTPQGGSVVIGLRAEPELAILFVRDTGEGIAPDDLPRVWERFFKTDRSRSGGGTGLGLAIVKHIAQTHGGNVAATSTVGEGSQFELRLPLGTTATQQVEPALSAG